MCSYMCICKEKIMIVCRFQIDFKIEKEKQIRIVITQGNNQSFYLFKLEICT